jgi:4'-phosphopantetheinyl transferase
VAPASWRFRAERRGRPEIDAPGGVDLRFNLSHTDGLAACGVVRELDLGVDVEAGSRVRRHLEVADRFFSRREARALRALPEEDRVGRFLDTWTLKEAYIKARGQGLALPLDGFTFDLDADREAPLRIEFERDLGDEPTAWQFALERVGAHHRLAIAVRRGARPDLRIVVRRTDPAPPA